MTPFHFHRWSKWGKVEHEDFSRPSVVVGDGFMTASAPSDFDGQVRWTEMVQYRECESCGAVERREVR